MKKNGKISVRLIVSLIATLVMMFAFSAVAFATDGEGSKMQVSTDGTVNVRSDASANSDKVGSAEPGQIVTVLESKDGSDGNVWYKVSFNSTTGYIRGDFLKPYTDPNAPAEEETPEGETPEGEVPEGEFAEGEAPVESEEPVGSYGEEANIVGDGTFTPMEGEGQPNAIPDGFRGVYVRISGVEIPAWTNDRYYIFYATSPLGNVDWYIYDQVEQLYIRYDASFMAGTSDSVSGNSASNGSKGVPIAIVIVLVVVCVALVITTAIMGIKIVNGGGSGYDDDDDDDEDYDDDDDEDDDDDDDDRFGSSAKKKLGIFGKARKGFDEDDDDEDDEDEDEDDEDEDDGEDGYYQEPVTRRPVQQPQRQMQGRPAGQMQGGPQRRPMQPGQGGPQRRPMQPGQGGPQRRPMQPGQDGQMPQRRQVRPNQQRPGQGGQMPQRRQIHPSQSPQAQAQRVARSASAQQPYNAPYSQYDSDNYGDE